MKKRDGFVSNSSSVSFCIYGASVSSEEGEELESLIGDLGLTSGCFQDDDMCIGRDWSSIGDNETGAQFKADVRKKLEKLTGRKDLSLGTHEEGYYNG